jgi:hypothetical protein
MEAVVEASFKVNRKSLINLKEMEAVVEASFKVNKKPLITVS